MSLSRRGFIKTLSSGAVATTLIGCGSDDTPDGRTASIAFNHGVVLEYKQGCSPIMDDETLESYIRQYIEGQNTPEIIFSWQGGEPTMLGHQNEHDVYQHE